MSGHKQRKAARAARIRPENRMPMNGPHDPARNRMPLNGPAVIKASGTQIISDETEPDQDRPRKGAAA
jgi:hypothetical protein